MPEPQAKCPVVAVLNMKGGVGKTTIAGNVFREMFRGAIKSVLLIDFDSQFNLSQLLLTRAHYDAHIADHRSILRVLTPDAPDSVFATSDEYLYQTPDAADCVVNLRYLTDHPEIKLDLLPGNFGLALLNLREPARLKIPTTRFVQFLDKTRLQYDVIVLDCNPSSSFVTRCAVESATHLLIPVRPDKYSVLGVEMVWKYSGDLRPHAPPIRKIVLNDFDSASDASRETEAELRRHGVFGPHVLAERVYHSTLLSAKRDYTGFAVDQKVPYRETVKLRLQAVATELAQEMGLTDG